MAAPRVALVCCLAELSELAQAGASTSVPCGSSSGPTTAPSSSKRPAVVPSGEEGVHIDKFQHALGAVWPAARSIPGAARLQGTQNGSQVRAVALAKAAQPVSGRDAVQGLIGSMSASPGPGFHDRRTWEAEVQHRPDPSGAAGLEGAPPVAWAESDEAGNAAGVLSRPLGFSIPCVD